MAIFFLPVNKVERYLITIQLFENSILAMIKLFVNHDTAK